MLHRFFAHISSESSGSGSRKRLGAAFSLILVILLGLSYCDVAHASSKPLSAKATKATGSLLTSTHHAAAGRKIPVSANASKKKSAGKSLKVRPNFSSSLGGSFLDFASYPFGQSAPTANASGIAVDYLGNIYFSDYDDGNVWQWNVANQAWYEVISGHSEVYALAVDYSLNVYVTDESTATVYQEIPTGVGTWTESILDSSTFSDPVSLSLDIYGNLFVADYDTGNIVMEYNNYDGTFTPYLVNSTPFNGPTAVAVDSNEDVFVADSDNEYFNGQNWGYLFEIQYAGGGFQPPAYIDYFGRVTGLALDSKNNLFVTDEDYEIYPAVYAVTFVQPSGNDYITQLKGNNDGEFVAPYGLAIDANNNLYTADYYNWDIVELSNSFGSVSVRNSSTSMVEANFDVYGTGTTGSTVLTSQGASGQSQFGVAYDGCAGLSISGDTYCSVQVTFSPTTPGILSGGILIEDSSSNEVVASQSFSGIGIAPQASFFPGTYSYLAETGGELVPDNAKFVAGRKANHQKMVKGLSGNGKVPSFDINGSYPGYYPVGVATDAAGAIYVADSGTCAIYKSADGGLNWTTLTTQSYNYGYDFDYACPTGGIAVDGAGNVFWTTGSQGTIPGVAVDYYDGGNYTGAFIAAYYTPTSEFYYANTLTVDGSDNLFVGGSDDSYNDGYVYYVPASTYYGTFEYYWNLNSYGVSKISPQYSYIGGVSVDPTYGDVLYTGWSNSGNNTVNFLIPSTTGQYTDHQVARGLDTPTTVQWTSWGDFYVLDTGDNSGTSTLYWGTPATGVGGPTVSGYSLTPISISNYDGNNPGGYYYPYFYSFTTDIHDNFYLVDDGYYGLVTEIDVNDPPTVVFADTTVGVETNVAAGNPTYTDYIVGSPAFVGFLNTGNDYLYIETPMTGLNPSVSTNFLYNGTYVTYFPGTTLPVSNCPQLTTSSEAVYLYGDQACALPVAFDPLVAGNITGSLVITDNSLYGYTPSTVTPTKTKVASKEKLTFKPAKAKPADSTTTTQTVILQGYAAKATPTVVLLSSQNPSLLSNVVAFEIAVDGYGTTPTGTITLYDGSNVIGTGTLSGGQVEINVAFATAGSKTISAVYQDPTSESCSGDANYNCATSNTVAQVIEDFTLTFTGSSSSASGSFCSSTFPIVKNGDSLTLGFTLTPVGASSTLFPTTFSAVGGPQNTSYTFTPSSVAAGASSTGVTITINIPVDFRVASNSAPKVPGNSKLPIAPLALAALLLPFAAGLRKASKRMARLVAVLLLAVAGISATVTLSGCGANVAATYQVVVTATSGTLSHTATCDIVVTTH